MQWIWVDNNADVVNSYAEFKQEFSYSAGEVTLDLSVADEYIVCVNGKFVDCGHYDDYPHFKVYDTLTLTNYCQQGKNELLIRAYYQGTDTFQCVKSAPKLWFVLKLQDTVIESSSTTLARPDRSYESGEIEVVSNQLSFTFHHDARMYGTTEWKPACCLDCDIVPIPRPIKKLNIFPPAPGVILNQGVLMAAKEKREKPLTPAERVYYDLTAPRYADRFVTQLCPPAFIKPHNDPMLPLPCGGYRFTPEEGYDGIYLIVDLGKEIAGFPHLELEAEEGTLFDIGYGEHLDDGRVRSYVGMRNFAFTYTSAGGRASFTNYFKRIAGRYMELHVRTDKPFILYNLSIQSAEYPLTIKPYPAKLTDTLARKIYDISVETLRLCMHEHYEDCPWREQALYAMDSRNQALAGYYAFDEYEFPKACWQLFVPSQREDGLFAITTPSHTDLTIVSFSLAWVIACKELVEYGGEEYNIFLEPMRSVLDTFLPQLSDGILRPFIGKDYWNFFEWADGVAGSVRTLKEGPKDAPLTLFFCAALQSYKALCEDGRYDSYLAGIQENFHKTFWNEEQHAYRTRAGEEHYAELVQALALRCGLVPKDLEASLREQLASHDNPWVKVTLSHFIYKLDALMMEPEKYYNAVESDIMETWGSMVLKGATSFWETIDGGDAFSKAGSLCHGWSAAPVYFWGKYIQYKK